MLLFDQFCCLVSVTVLFFGSNYVHCVAERKLSPTLNPGCNSTCGKLIVIKAERPNDILYFIWDFGRKPTFLMAETPANTDLTIKWDKFADYQEKSIAFTIAPVYVFGVVISNVYEFNDQDDSGILHSDDSQTIAMPTEHFNWTIRGLLDDLSGNTIQYSISADGYQYGNITKEGVFNITSYAFGSIGHAEDLPHLLHSENSSQIDLIINHLTPSFQKSRFAIEFITFSSNDRSTSVAKLSAKKTIDDENTPGVFILDTLLVEDKNSNGADSGFMQWRPIVYTSANKVVSNSTKTFEYGIVNVVDSVVKLNSSLLFAFYGTNLSNFYVKSENVSFGWSNDGFYSKTNYSSWSFLIGVGSPPEYGFSMMVFLIIAIGLGLPTLVILGGTVFMVYRKVRTGD